MAFSVEVNSKPQTLVKDAARDEDNAETTDGSSISDSDFSFSTESQSERQSKWKALLRPPVCICRAALREAGNDVLEKINAEKPCATPRGSIFKEAKDASKKQITNKAPVPYHPPGLDEKQTNAKPQDSRNIRESFLNALKPARVRGFPDLVVNNTLQSMMPLKKTPLFSWGPTTMFDPTLPLKKSPTTFLTQEPPSVLTSC